MSTDSDIVEAVIEAGGGVAALAKALGLPLRNVWAWKNRGRIPAEWCLRTEQAIDQRITAAQMRPDVFVLPTAETATPKPALEQASGNGADTHLQGPATATSANGDGSGRVGQRAAA